MNKRTPALAYSVTLIAGGCLLACQSSGPPDGQLRCGSAPNPCPDGYECAAWLGTCWRKGNVPQPDASQPYDAPATDVAAPLDGPSPDGLSADRLSLDTGHDGASLPVDVPRQDSAIDAVPPVDVPAEAAPVPPVDAPADSSPDVPLPSDSGIDAAATACVIAGTTYASGKANPTNICQFCDPSATASAWSSQSEGVACGAGTGQYCHQGACTNGCLIDSVFYAVGAANPANACQTCLAATPTAWTKTPDGQACGSAKICSAGLCQEGCWIGGSLVASSGTNPTNSCQVCLPGKSTTDWSNNDTLTAVPCGTCGGTASCVGGALGPCSITAGTYYPDVDKDGYGASTGAITSCSKPAGYATNHSDCCDSDASAHPGQTATFEVADACGSFDYNCDGAATAKSNGPTDCGAPNCVGDPIAGTCVDQGGCTCAGGSCQVFRTAACGETYSTSTSFCYSYVAGGTFYCSSTGNGGPVGPQQCN